MNLVRERNMREEKYMDEQVTATGRGESKPFLMNLESLLFFFYSNMPLLGTNRLV